MFELPRATEGRAGIGALLAMGLYFGELIFLFLIGDSFGSGSEHAFIIMMLVAPLLQSVYVVPLYLALKSNGKSATANGLMGGAVALAIIYYAIVGVIAFVG